MKQAYMQSSEEVLQALGVTAEGLSSQEEQTPLQKKLDSLGKTLSFLVLGICVFIFVFNLIMHGEFSLPAILETFMVAVSLAVAAIPKGLATVVTPALFLSKNKREQFSFYS